MKPDLESIRGSVKILNYLVLISQVLTQTCNSNWKSRFSFIAVFLQNQLNTSLAGHDLAFKNFEKIHVQCLVVDISGLDTSIHVFQVFIFK